MIEVNLDGVEVFVDGNSQGVVIPEKRCVFRGWRRGFTPLRRSTWGTRRMTREEMVYPGQTTTVSVKIVTVVRRKKAALDEFDQGMEDYQKGFEKNYKKAAEHFERALEIDPKFSQAALYLARTENALFDEEKAQAGYRKAIEIDPDYAEARASFGGMLLDREIWTRRSGS